MTVGLVTRKSREIGRPRHRGQGKVFFLALGCVIAREPTAWWPPWQTLANVDNMFLTTEGYCTSRQRCRILGLAFAEMSVVEGDWGGDVRGVTCGDVTQRCDAFARIRGENDSPPISETNMPTATVSVLQSQRYSGYRSASRCWSRLESLKGHRESEDLLIQSTFLSIESGKTRGCKFDFLVQAALARSEDTYTS
ncbi:hypothetical protein C8J56DRAFT_886580 [Mycena floridula]|nr:hypothetical protein C8J56DRAFT_886580 [Mycena floridula]